MRVKLTQIDNACCIYEADGYKLLADPWLTDGAFEGSWFHYPPLVTDFNYVKDVNALYISHLHPDHYDETTLKQFRKDIPIIILDHTNDFLFRKLVQIGFTNIIKIKDKESALFGPFKITVYAPFVSYPFYDSVLGNFLDSAIVVEANGKVVLNGNDNTPSIEAARMLHEKHGDFHIAQLKDSLAGAYPSCFRNLSHDEKLSEAKRLINRQLTAMCEVAKVLKTEWFQPFAGDYQLGGKLVDKNPYLGVASKQYSAEFIAKAGIKPLILNEQGSIDLVSGELTATYRKSVMPYHLWTDQVKKTKFAWENDSEPDFDELTELADKSRSNLWKWQTKLNFKPDYKIEIQLVKGCWRCFNLNSEKSYPISKCDLTIIMDNRLLKRIMTKQSHYNNAEIGSHIDFIRKGPYNPDVSMIMSFFHV